MRNLRGIPLLALACSMWLAVGCANAPKMSRPEWLSFGKKPPKDDKIVTPRDKMEQLRALAKEGPKMSPELQERVSSELAQGIAHEQDPVLRAQILRTLGHFPSEKSAGVLAAGLHDKNRDVRIAACEGLGRHKGPAAAEELSHAIADDADVDVRLAAARALGEAADPKSVAALGTALEDHNPAMQHRAMSSLKKVSGQDYGTDVEAWKEYAKSGQGPAQPTLVQRILKWF